MYTMELKIDPKTYNYKKCVVILLVGELFIIMLH